MDTNLSRRGFLTGAAAAGALAAMGLAGCAPQQAAEGTKTADTGAASSWRDKPEMPTDIAETLEADIVVVGAGNGGVVAAATAAQNGAKVIVLEKAGEVMAAREAVGAINSKLEPDHPVDVPELLNYAADVQSGDANMLLYKTWAEKSGEMIEWYKETLEPKGMLFPFEWHAPDDPHAYYPAMCYNPCIGEYNPDGPNYNSYAHVAVLADVFTQELGGEILFNTPAKMLVQDESGKVTGVIAESADKGFIQVNAAKGVIICTGGYGANTEMLNDLCETATKWCGLTSATTEEGDGIRMALWAGAELEPGGGAMVWNRAILPDGFEFSDDRTGGDIFLPGSQPFLHVNVNGERFMNEDQCYPMSYAQGAQQPRHFSWIVWDGNYWEDIAQFDTCGCSRLYPAPSGTAFNADVYDCEALTKEHLDEFWLNPRLENGSLKKADTLEELADMMEFDADQKATFLATVARYNEMAAKGEDTDFGKPAYRLSDVEKAPFYAARIAGALLVTIHGVITDVNSQPLNADGKPIENLYVCGNDQGGFYPHNYPSNFTGINAGRVATFARIAAKHALGVE
ncbi:FAD-dependent oxidoreductase [uncultured Adlercreutzia sp.]|uniref:FAD-dependent oxidoreductase n=2 Tax=uncultured Adlercreutzia sp. TaxID=875803 RepID=UPI0026336B4D|nr:FAD-dependent oxidoreductase [uncultured Adlercreutzia sp.]MCI9262631.1 FAD-dependent oxidoreductase [Eggerthellaceae bacterium]